MRKISKVIAGLLIVSLLACCFLVFAYDNDVKYFDYTTVCSGIVDNKGMATLEDVVKDGQNAVCVTPVPEYVKDNGDPDIITLDNYSLANKLKVDLDVYKYVTFTYRYESPDPKSVVKTPHIALMRSAMFTFSGMPLEPIDNTESVPNAWTTVVYEIPDLEEYYLDPGAVHLLKQIHIQPYGNDVKNSDLSEEDKIYIQSITFHVEKPARATVETPYINGLDGGLFGIGQTMTRAQACTVVARLIAGGDNGISDCTSAFTDVATGEWYTRYIAFCEAKGLLGSYDGEFLPNRAITRAEFVELVYKMGLLKDSGKNGTFTDVPATHPRAEVIAAAGKAGLVNGYANGDGSFSFKPDNTISREEVVTVINNAYGRSSDKDMLVALALDRYYHDVDLSHWAFADIIDASIMHFACRTGDEANDSWLYYVKPELAFTEKEYEAALEKVLEVDELTEKRIAEIRNTETAVSVKGRKFYVSADGNDNNDGRSPEKAIKTIDAVNELSLRNGDGVFFRRGDTFRGQVSAKAGVTYSAYGEGEKPRIYMSPQNFGGAENWEMTEVRNVWKLKIPIMNDVGLMVFNEGEAWSEKRIKGRADFPTGSLEDLDKDFAMWHDVEKPTGVEGYVYLRCDNGNPGELFETIEAAPSKHIFSVRVDNVTIDNLCIRYTGSHGVGSGDVKNLKVQNCEFGWIGGSWFNEDTLSRYGNAVEIYGAVDGYVVDNCYIYQVYDAGVTHQLTKLSERECVMEDVHYTNNVITYTTYPIEYFIDAPNDGVNHKYVNLEIANNIMRYTGYGFGDQRPNKTEAATIKSWNTYNEAEGYTVKNNIFDRSKYMLIQLGAEKAEWMPVMSDNVYIIEEGANFGNIGTESALATPALVSYVKTNSKDENAQVYVLRAEQ